ncbi:von Willebrand factor type A domain protein [Pigmentiphaga humi]|uniref:von Willebrand factor type A domain protein n=1 Tax=Pigmentiphaga humi TaxID=2478468 RepID=A0A3P4B3F7_9BURK|nr:VWA domain-containing protein [Pigmentiphaga humi]VCU70451.1 von Willebrand factor type A domain protein [Pigmentiphaga humi]
MSAPNLPALSFLWPSMLWLLLLVPALGFAYWRLSRRRRQVAVRYPALAGLGYQPSAARRILPPCLLLLGLAAMIVAIARPQALMMLPSRLETVVLAMDMSGSMRATDVKPSRIYAAQQAAKLFVDKQPANVSVAVVAVAGAAAVVQSPTRKREDVVAAIERLEPQRGTALGSGLIISLATVLPQERIDVERFLSGGNARPSAAQALAEAAQAEAAVPGSYASGAIVLLSDGQSNTGPDALKAAEVAARYGVRIFTVGIGTPEGTTLSTDGWSMRVKLDEAVLKKVADITGAQYFQAQDAKELQQVYRSLSARLAFDKRDVIEVTALFTALGVLLAVCSGLLSLWWFGRVQ